MTIWQPHPYQETARQFLHGNPNSGLFLDPGLGKTSISLSVISDLVREGKTNGVLLIAPLRVCYLVWPLEIRKWDNFNNLSYTILHKRGKASIDGKPKDIYIINPEGLPWLFEKCLEILQDGFELPFDTLWIDESTKFKSPKAKTRFAILKDMICLFKRRHIMTGTPAPRGLMDLWSQIYLLDEGEALTPNFWKFRRKYFQQADRDGFKYVLRSGADKTIHNLIAPKVLEMSSKDYLDMPDLIFNNIQVELPVKAKKLYSKMEQEFFLEIDGHEASAMQQAQASMKCHQIANGKVYKDWPKNEYGEPIKDGPREIIDIHDAKIVAIKDLVDELAGKPLLVAFQYKHDLIALKKAFGDDTPFIGSGVSEKHALQICEDWNAGKTPILLAQPSSMSHGLNLQASGNDICWYSVTWDLESYMQFNARIYRQGVTGDSVRVHHIVSSETVDEPMLERLGEKAEQQKDLRESLKRYRIARNAK